MPSPYIPMVSQNAGSTPWGSLSSYGSLGSGTFGLNDNYLDLGGASSVLPITGTRAPELQLPSFSSGLTGGAAKSGPSFMDGLLGYKDTDGMTHGGWGGAALGLGQGLLGAFMGMKQYGLAKDSLEENKRQFAQNYAAQKTTTNAALEDRQRARVASNAGAYESVGSYMDRNAIR